MTDDKPLPPQTLEDHRRALGRLTRLTAQILVEFCRIGEVGWEADKQKLHEWGQQLQHEIREVCRPIDMRTAPGRIIETKPPPPETLVDAKQDRVHKDAGEARPARSAKANEGRKMSPVPEPEIDDGPFPAELFRPRGGA